MALEKELATYKRELPTLLADEGKFVLIHGDRVIGVYDTYKDAVQNGYDQCALDPFLVKRIQTIEQVQYFSRPIVQCPT